MPALADIQPAGNEDVMLYAPYYQGQKRKLLPLALGLYQQGNFEGERSIENAQSVPYVATWFVSKLPSELTRCRLQFDGSADLTYEVDMTNSEFIDFLIDVIRVAKGGRLMDFPKEFYEKLLRMSAAQSWL
ncbi:hypothetical protein KR51_00035100 [Rubidibacter lacunae KORDI 51-2]|uniref:Uncharacterized protein n=1 Tax=Rubidibacter lacunae KORDI 51-2 TaxID=582515 RepID=U5DFF7_9CHRO|nr:type IV pilus biogenesis protein EbsA [Rubidibacter lacunae]ERN40022.1 hypothetical protein KR51_00035100 [Rubidibacter lacunae KORDI 51-2]